MTRRRLFPDPVQTLTQLTAGHDRLARLRFGRRQVIVVAHPQTAWELLSQHAGDLSKGPALRRARMLLGNGLLTAEGLDHREHRRLAQPAFSRAAISGHADTITGATAHRTTGWAPGQPLDLATETAAIALDIAGQALFGVDLIDCTYQLRTDLATVADTTSLVKVPGPGLVRRSRALRRIHAVTDEILRAGAGHPASSTGTGAGLVRAATPTGPQRPVAELLADAVPTGQLHDEAVTLLLAGHETTALTLAWAISEVARHPAIRRRLERELDDVLGDGNGGHRAPAADDSLPVTEAVVAEALRLWPPAWVIGRHAQRPFTLDGVPITTGTILLVSPFGIHRDPRWWTDPDTFAPDRWLTPDAEGQPLLHHLSRPGSPYLPFGIGPRRCLGEHFAWLESRLVLAGIFSDWSLEPLGPAPRYGRPTLTLRPDGPLPVVARPRRGRVT